MYKFSRLFFSKYSSASLHYENWNDQALILQRI